jgi:peptide/nickel transport system substrate-binding protein
VYNSLVAFDPHGYPKIIGDLAKSWTISDDKMTWTFTLHQGVTFHDDSPLTSADIKASWDKIISPPEGVVSPRKSLYQMVKSIETPDPHTVVFRLHYASPSFLSMLAHPANFMYAKKYLDQDPNYYKKKCYGQRAVQVEGIREGRVYRDGAQPEVLETGVALHGRHQVLHHQG